MKVMSRYELRKELMEQSYCPNWRDDGYPDWRDIPSWNVWDTHTDELVDTIGTVRDWRGGIRGGINYKMTQEKAQAVVDILNQQRKPDIGQAMEVLRREERYQEMLRKERSYYQELGEFQPDPYWVGRLLENRHNAWLAMKNAKIEAGVEGVALKAEINAKKQKRGAK